MNELDNIIKYESVDGKVSFEVNLDEDSVWLTQKQMAELFSKARNTITEHINSIYLEGELDEKVVCRDFRHTTQHGALSGKMQTGNIKKYNLDVIISVGYRVKSKQGVHFRQWATKVLKDYMIKGYALNERKLSESRVKVQNLESALSILTNVVKNHELNSNEAIGLLKIVRDYTYALDLLDQYDHQCLKVSDVNRNEIYKITYEEARVAIDDLGAQFIAKGEHKGLFGQERGEMFKGCLESIYQTFNGEDLYPSIEEKASHLLYFLIKNHPFNDGNKRIGAFIFIWFLENNAHLYREDGTKRIEDNALVAICLMVAQSDPKEKNIMTNLIVNLINAKNV